MRSLDPSMMFSPPWLGESLAQSQHRARFNLRRAVGLSVIVDLERCAQGRLQLCYPVGADDIEVRVTGHGDLDDLSSVLTVVAEAVHRGLPACRRVVFAVERGDEALGNAEKVVALQRAGYRYVVDVDIPTCELSLFVSEPSWVTVSDAEIDRVPNS